MATSDSKGYGYRHGQFKEVGCGDQAGGRCNIVWQAHCFGSAIGDDKDAIGLQQQRLTSAYLARVLTNCSAISFLSGAFFPQEVYRRHNQASAIDFINYVVEKFPFRIRTIRTDRGHEFQALFHWHVADLGMEHVYIKPRTPQLNGKVERSHRTDKDEFYQLLTYRDDVDLEKKLAVWERFYNYDRPHGAHGGKTPYEALREKLS